MNLKTAELRKLFLEFFRNKEHKVFPSDSLVPDDESLLFTSAGMNQFKPHFLGQVKDITRAASCQKCLRTGDLENVGRTAYHHTFFEMLGNFSFGDYFKREAIAFAWEFMTESLKKYIKPDDLWVSVYKDDLEAYSIWKETIGVAKNRIVKLGAKSNFWPANAPSDGPNGPCGPCSEIFFDQGVKVGCKDKNCNPDCSCGRFVEVWNLVFTQFNRVGKNKLEPLPQKNIDTGMGLERMACVLQGKTSNFEIDILAPAVDVAKKLIGLNKPDKQALSLVYAIVDHARAATFAISDGVYPSNEDRGYVIRKIIRKALWSANILGKREVFLYNLSGSLVEIMQDAYPELKSKREVIAKVIQAEEEKFLTTLQDGQKQFLLVAESLKAKNKSIVPAADLFRFYDTYGLPLELSREMAKASKLDIDQEGFAALLKQQQARSRKKSMFEESIFQTGDFDLNEETKFAGYDILETQAQILRLFLNQEETETISQGQSGLVILDKSCFYPESGGQLFDKGIIKSDQGQFQVEEVFKVNQAIVHKGRVVKGAITKGKVSLVVDEKRRKALARAHSATHLLQAALRKALGKHVIQQGSLVDEDKFRFDFTHFTKMSDQELEKIEALVKEFIAAGTAVCKKELSLDQAKKEGALAFFKDKYQDKVRVVSIADYSKELCGGTHVANTKDIENFAIISESSISSGIRRIKAVVGKPASLQPSRQALRERKEQAKKAQVQGREAEQLRISQAVSELEKGISDQDLETINGVQFLFNFDKIDSSSSGPEQTQILVGLSDRLKQRFKSAFIFMVRSLSGKDIFICSATDDLIKKGISCKKFISQFKQELSLAGGGSDKLVKGAIANRPEEDFVERLKGAFKKFTS